MRRPLVILSALAVCATASAQRSMQSRDLPQDESAQSKAQKFLNVRAKGRQTKRDISHVLRDLEWHKKLEKAQVAAKKQNRPILWIQLLGDLTGYT